MDEAGRPDVTLHTLHQDLGEVRSDLREVKTDMREVKTDMREVKTLLATRLPPPEWPGEMLRVAHESTQLLRENTQLLRESNRLSEERFARLDTTLREQTIETHSILRALAEGQRQLWAEIRALIARIDALIRGRGDGSPAA